MFVQHMILLFFFNENSHLLPSVTFRRGFIYLFIYFLVLEDRYYCSTPVSYTHLDVYKRQVIPFESFY